MKRKFLFICLFLLGILPLSTYWTQCNGGVNLCSKRYNEVAYLTTHNAFNSDQDGFGLPNQNYNIQTQLEDGVRGFMIDVYDLFGTPTVYHGSWILGSAPFSDYLTDIKVFLDDNPNEIVTLILECYISANDVENSLNQTGLSSYLYTHLPETEWPTLQEMIDLNQRLVVFTDVDDASGSQGWYHYVWDYAVETHYTANSTADFTCDYNRGVDTNDLFIFNHFITSGLTGTGQAAEAAVINTNTYLLNRITDCYSENGKFPNFVTLDFYDLGDGMDVVNILNDNFLSIEKPLENQLITPILIATNVYKINLSDPSTTWKVYNIKGKDVTHKIELNSMPSNVTVDLQGLPKGIYLLSTELKTFKLVKL